MNKTTFKFFLVISLGLGMSGCGKSFEVSTYEVPTDIASDVNSGQGTGDISFTGELGSNLDPVLDPQFSMLSNGIKLGNISVKGKKLSLTRGTGSAFTSSLKNDYQNLKKATQTDVNHKVQWTLMDLSSHQVVAKSLSSNRKLFGASSSKIYVGSAFVEKQNAVLSSSQMQLMADMLVVSSNVAWTNLQTQIGDGNADKGRERIQNFTQKMGYMRTRGYQGSWGKIHGNELIPDEAVETLYDLYHNAFTGAAIVWKLMHTCRTGASRGLKYIPSNIYVGGKTGTYDGPTENPETGATYNVAIRNHLLVFYVGGRQYGLAILSNSGTDQSAALLAGGLIREYGGIQ
ncbi:MAG: serine hydrolase [Bdellovibrionaceae bacterium]|nr:serine hydrolase [Bdellovibrio sp.]